MAMVRVAGGLAAFAFLAVLGATAFAQHPASDFILILSLRPLVSAGDFFVYVLDGRGLTRRVALGRTLSLLLVVPAILYIHETSGEPRLYAGVLVLEALLFSTWLVISARASVSPGTSASERPGAKDFREVVRRAFPLLVSALAIVVYTRLDQVMVGVMSGASELGRYASAARVSELGYFLPMVFGVALSRQIVGTLESDPGGLTRTQSTLPLFEIGILSGYVSFTALAASGPFVVPFVFGPQYADSVPVLQIHAASNVFVAAGIVRTRFLSSIGLEGAAMTCVVTGALFNLLANLLLIPSFGASGAAVGTLAAGALSAVPLLVFGPRGREVFVLYFRGIAAPMFVPFRWRELARTLSPK